MGHEREYEVEQIYKKEHHRNRDAKPVEALGGRTFSDVKGSWKNQRDRSKHEHGRLSTRADSIEVLLGSA
jgi:hypothetical protein